MTRILVVICIFSVVPFLNSPAQAGKKPAVDLHFVNPQVTTSTNIHFNRYYCTECHLDIQDKGKKPLVRFADFTQTCRCHGYTPDTYTHPVGVTLSPEKKAKIPPRYPLTDGRITCKTCHDLRLQCRDDETLARTNRAFLRINPYLSRTAICYQCHDERKYRMLDPHNQLDEQGRIKEEKCLYCHQSVPDVQHATLKKRRPDDEVVSLIGHLDVVCYRCHYKQTRQHPINANHLKKPTRKIMRSMRWAERKFGIVMPLDSSGKVTCITCHNPHEKGVIPSQRTASAGAGERARLRLPRVADKICLACHSNN